MYERNSAQLLQFWPIVLKLYKCFDDGLKICMALCFLRNLKLFFFFFFHFFLHFTKDPPSSNTTKVFRECASPHRVVD